MYIDKSFQLLSTDSGKQATDETRRQDTAEGEAAFSDLFGAELDSQEQQRQTASDNKAGQEIAALLTQQAQKTEALQTQKGIIAKGLADKNLADTILTESSLSENMLSESSMFAQTAGGDSTTDDGQMLKPLPELQQLQINSEDLAKAQTAQLDNETEQTTKQNPWLAIIHQSHDFNAILSQSAAVVSTNEVALSKPETLVAELLGLPVSDQGKIDAKSTKPQAEGDSLLSKVAVSTNEISVIKSEVSGEAFIDGTHPQTALSDASILTLVAGQSADQQAHQTKNSNADEGNNSRSIIGKLTKLPAEQVSLQEHVKTDKLHALTAEAAMSSAAVDATEATKALDQMTTMTADETAEHQLRSSKAEATDVGLAKAQVDAQQIADQQIAMNQNTAQQLTARQSAAELTAEQAVLADLAMSTQSTSRVVESELPQLQDEKSVSTSPLLAMSASVTATAKNAPQSFAQFQKAVNAAAGIAQKQQIQAELTQNQTISELATQQPTRFAELNQLLPATQQDTPITLSTLLQTERPIIGGGAMGSSTGQQQQQQAASQLFAARLNDTINSSEAPALNLLEPNAATQLKERVMFQVNQKIQSAEIKLAPEELGSMQIKVQLQQDQLSVQFVVQQAGAKEALEQQMPRLREMLEEQGMQLTDGQVSQQREGSDDQKQARQRHQVAGQGVDIDDEPLQQQAIVRVSDRMVDYYA